MKHGVAKSLQIMTSLEKNGQHFILLWVSWLQEALQKNITHEDPLYPHVYLPPPEPVL